MPFAHSSSPQTAHLIDEDQQATLCGRYRGRIHLNMDDKVSENIRHCRNCEAKRKQRMGQ